MKGSLADPRIAAGAVTGQDVIFHLAYDVRQDGSANVKLSETLFAAAEAEGRARIVHLSSIVVYDDWPSGQVSEASPRSDGTGGAYRRAKIAIEDRLLAGQRPALILQPTLVWGPGSGLWTERFADALRTGTVVLPEPEGLFQGVFVDDVVQACLRAAVLPDPGREAFIINGAQPFPWSALLCGYRDLLDCGTVRFEPAEALRPRATAGRPGAQTPSIAARVSALGRRLVGRERFEALVRGVRRSRRHVTVMMPDAHMFELMVARGACPPDRARTRLGYVPDFDLARGLAETAAALRGAHS
jgi:nucleoside-diphosphate-sugar epimerase